jgi:SAM-dependent methyltransferase
VGRAAKGMRGFWDEAARRNAAWYVDTTVSFDEPDMGAFFETGRKIVDQALGRSPVPPAARELAVEIGSGLGRNCLALTDHFDRVIGVDISPEMVRQADGLVDDDRVSFHVGEGADLPAIADGTADFVLSFTVFQHIPEVGVIQSYLREAARVLRPGGVVAFQWNNQATERRWRLRRAVLSTLQRSGLRREAHDRNAVQFLGTTVDLARIESTLSSAGMDLVKTEGLGTLFCWAWAVKR